MLNRADFVKVVSLCCVVLISGCAFGSHKHQSKSTAMTGKASWYGPGFNRKRTASGERFRKGALTAAHKTLPFGTIVKVTNLRNGKSVKVRINDRGPFVEGRIIDLSKGAAKKLDMVKAGVVPVRLNIVKRGSG